MQLAIGLVVGASTLVLPASLAAQPRPASVLLEWSAPPECPTQSDVLAEVARLLRRPLVPSIPPTLRVRADLARTDTGTYRVQLHTVSDAGAGQREIDDPACQRIAEAAAVVIALAIDPDALTPSPSPSPPPSASPRPVPHVVARPVRFSVAPLVFGDLGTLPQPSVGVGITASVVVRSLVRVEFVGSTWLPQDIAAGNGLLGGAHAEMLFLGGLRGCLEHAFGRLEVDGCLGLQGGALQAAGFGISAPTTSIGLWFDAALGAGVGLRLADWLALRLLVEGALTLDHPVITVQAYRGGDVTELPVYEPSWFVGRASFGPEFRF